MKQFLISIILVLTVFGCTADTTYNLYEVCSIYTFNELEPYQQNLDAKGDSFSQLLFNDFSSDLKSLPKNTDAEFFLNRISLNAKNSKVTLFTLSITTPEGNAFTITSDDTQVLNHQIPLDLMDLRSGHTTLSLVVVGYDIPDSVDLTLCFESLVDSKADY